MSSRQKLVKDVFDRAGASIGFVLAIPLFLLAILIIKTFSKGPVLFVQERIGRDLEPFEIYKFRTMHVAKPGDGNGSVTVFDDPRLFPGARLLRKWKIDELPQLFNILNGTMSLVGPRPTVDDDYRRMTGEQRRRAVVKPGLTGLAQISGGTALLWPQRIEYDLQYIEHDSFWLDVQILLKTVWLVATGRADTHPTGDDEWAAATPTLNTGAEQMSESKSDPADARAAKQRQSADGAGFPNWPEFNDEQISAVAAVLRSGRVNYWTGNEGRLFEQEFAAALGAEHAIAVANGTLALELALYGLGIGPGDEVVVPCRTFIASASAVVMRGARPLFADVDPISQNVTAETIADALTVRTQAIIVVHLAGWPCDMDPIIQLARERGLKVIEDCAQAHGAAYKGRPVGSIGDAGAFSFCQDKIITTGGEGGMLTTNHKELWERAWSFKDHGKSWDAVTNRRHPTIFKWVHESLGTNWRMTEMQSAIGRVALGCLAEWVQARRRHAAILEEAFAKIPALRTTVPTGEFEHSYYKAYVFVRPDRLSDGWNRDRIVRALQEQGIPCGTGICPEVYLEKAFDRAGTAPPERLPTAKALGETSLMFPVHPTLTEDNLRQMCLATENVLRAATAPRPVSGSRAA